MRFSSVLTLADAAELKAAAAAQCAATPELRELVTQFAAQKGGRAVFDNDGLSFRVVHRD